LGYITAEDDGTCNTFTAIENYTKHRGWVECNKFLFDLPATAHRLAFKWSEIDMVCYIDDVVVSINPNAITTQTIALSAGWNWFSTYIEADDLLEQLEESLGTSGIRIQGKNGTVDRFDYQGSSYWYGSFTDLTNEQMYKVHTNAACNVVILGAEASPAYHPIAISNGWNWIGFPCSESVSLETALSGFTPELNDIIKSKDGNAIYISNGNGSMWYGTLNTLEPGEGYMYKSNSGETKTLIFQTGSK
jgi:hypothetical protein